jgi:hypothetical protein
VRLKVPPTLPLIFNRRYGVISQKIELCIPTVFLRSHGSVLNDPRRRYINGSQINIIYEYVLEKRET